MYVVKAAEMTLVQKIHTFNIDEIGYWRKFDICICKIFAKRIQTYFHRNLFPKQLLQNFTETFNGTQCLSF